MRFFVKFCVDPISVFMVVPKPLSELLHLWAFHAGFSATYFMKNDLNGETKAEYILLERVLKEFHY